jgi:hypothetical protein
MSGTAHLASFGSIVQKGWFSAAAFFSVNRLNSKLIPTVDTPAHPILKFFLTRPKLMALLFDSSAFFDGTLTNWL